MLRAPTFLRGLLLATLALGLVPAGCSSARLKNAPDASEDADPGPAEGGAALPFPTTDAVEIRVNPQDGAAVLDAMKGATKSLHVSMYILSWKEAVDALIARKKAGVDVKVVLNRTFPDATTNDAVFAQLQGAGVPVVWGPAGYPFTHSKCVIVDGAVAWIMTMNFAFGAVQGNREFLAVDREPEDVAEAESIFQADFAGVAATPTGALVVSPTNSRDRLMTLVGWATQSIDVEGESLSDAALVTALSQAKGRGVEVRVLLADRAPTPAGAQAVAALKQAGIPVRRLASPYVHAKALVADGRLAYVGSQNFTANSLDNNRELGVVVSAATEVAKVAQTIAADFAAGTPQ